MPKKQPNQQKTAARTDLARQCTKGVQYTRDSDSSDDPSGDDDSVIDGSFQEPPRRAAAFQCDDRCTSARLIAA